MGSEEHVFAVILKFDGGRCDVKFPLAIGKPELERPNLEHAYGFVGNWLCKLPDFFSVQTCGDRLVGIAKRTITGYYVE